MEEKTFLDNGTIKVTNSRFIVPGQTYAMSGVTSVRQWKKDPSRFGPIALILMGLIFMFVGGSAIFFGILMIAGGIFWWIKQKPTVGVALSTAAGEQRALEGKDVELIDSVISALNDAIIHRG